MSKGHKHTRGHNHQHPPEEAVVQPDSTDFSSLLDGNSKLKLQAAWAIAVQHSSPLDCGIVTSVPGRRTSQRTRDGGNSSHNHQGTDMASCGDGKVHPTAEGIVTAVKRIKGYGNTVKIKHSDGTETFFAHLDGNDKPKVGDIVGPRDVIGNVGTTGSVTGGPIVHYEHQVDKKSVASPINGFVVRKWDVLRRKDLPIPQDLPQDTQMAEELQSPPAKNEFFPRALAAFPDIKLAVSGEINPVAPRQFRQDTTGMNEVVRTRS